METNHIPENSGATFRLTLQILVDHLSSMFPDVELYGRGNEPVLEGVRYYTYGIKPLKKFVYLVAPEDMAYYTYSYPEMSVVLLGRPRHFQFREFHNVIILPTATNSLNVLDQLQQTFERYRQWDYDIQFAQNSGQCLSVMLRACQDIFRNPLYSHDTNFYILSCPNQSPTMFRWEYNYQGNWLQIPPATIQAMMLHKAYADTFERREPGVYTDPIRGHRVLFVNLWKGDTYEGRICVEELQQPIQSGQFTTLAYLGKRLEHALSRQTLFQLYSGNSLEQFFSEYLDGMVKEPHEVQNALFLLHWKLDDPYICLVLTAIQPGSRLYSANATLGQIEALIPGSKAFTHHYYIVVIVNLHRSERDIDQVTSDMTMLQRQGLFRMGVSSEIHDFSNISQCYTQATMALHMGEKHNATHWCHRFSDYILEYILEQATRDIPVELLCSNQITLLEKYDQENGAQLVMTLKTLLEQEQNLQKTANELFIHRSTLLYRLERIHQIAKLDLNDPKSRLLLELSFAWRYPKTDTP